MDDDGDVLHMALLANPAARAGRAAHDLERVLDRLRTHGIQPAVLTADSPAEAATAARQAVEGGLERLLVLGGDGVMHLAAGAVAATPTVMGVIPAGTGNDFARALGLLDGGLEQRVDTALGDPVALDVIAAGGRTALSSVIAGFPSNVNARANRMAFPRGTARYTISTLLELPGMRPSDYRLVLDGEVHDVRAAVVVVANTRYFGAGMDICPDADPTDAMLDLCIVGDAGRLELLRSFQKVKTGAHIEHPKVTMHRATEVVIEGVGEVRADGEAFGELPVSLHAAPGALMVAGASTAPMVRD